MNSANVFDVAKYVLNRCGEMTTMKLQKLVYYCQAWSLAWDGKPLFEDEFEAWANGPVCRKLYNTHKGSFVVGGTFLSNKKTQYQFTEEEQATLNGVLDFYCDKESHWLSELTHKEMPWKEARGGVPEGMPSNNIITKDSMQQYYGGL